VAAARDSRASARGLLGRGPILLPAAAAVGALVFLAVRDAGYEVLPDNWRWVHLFVLGLVALALVAVPAAGRPSSRLLSAAGLLAGYAAWSYLSITWAEQNADAWDGANRTAFYVAVFVLFAFWPLGRRGAAILVGALALAIGVIAVIALFRAGAAANPESIIVDGRLAWPVHYPNGTVALWFLAFWPCVAFASRREVHPAWRGLFVAFAVVLANTSLLGQSRGWLFTLPIVLIVYLAVSPGRLRAAWALIGVGVATLVAGPTVLDAYEAVGAGEGAAAKIDSAVKAILIVAVIAGALAAGIGVLDRRRRVSRGAAQRTGQAMVAATLAVLAIGAVAFVAKEGNPVTWADARWEEFKGGPQPLAEGGSRLTQTLGSNRYDFWRVAWHGFKERPLTGIGADNFRHDYLRERTSGEEPYYPHSVVMRTLGQTGLIGAVLLLAAVGLATAAAVRATRTRPGLGGAVAAAAFTSFAYFAIHGSVDWFWELPALGGIAFALLGVAAGLDPRPAIHPRTRRAREPLVTSASALAATAVVGALLLVAIVPPLLAVRWTASARDLFNSDPQRAGDALERLDRAAGLNPFSVVPRLYQAQIVVAIGRPELAAGYYRDAIARDYDDEYSHLALGALESTAGRQRAAVAEMGRAVQISPRDELARVLLRDVRAGRTVTIQRVNKDFNQRRANRGR
jgi:O-antigen ligase